MKLATSLCLVVAVFAFGAATEIDDGWFVPQDDGTFEWVAKGQEDERVQPRAMNVQFYLYTKSNPGSPKLINVNDANALASSHFNKGNPTRFIIHGWKNDYRSEVNSYVRDAFLATGAYNIFCVDWSAHAQTTNYASAKNSVSGVGQSVAAFVDFLNLRGGMNFGTLGLVGHSLGAHVAGFTGKYVKRGRVNTIHGLDPALPLFNYNDCNSRLCQSDASYVESIQTNGGLLGFLQPIGKSAFYPNGGQGQPGCGLDATGGCAHSRAYIYYAEAIRKNDFPTMKCNNYDSAVKKNCGSTYSNVRMGAKSNFGVAGAYYVPVRSSSPYGMAG